MFARNRRQNDSLGKHGSIHEATARLCDCSAKSGNGRSA
jgi:hypothetical protein